MNQNFKNQEFEERVARIREILQILGREKVPLKDTVALYREGIAQIDAAEKQLHDARQIVEKMDAGKFKGDE